MQLAAGNGSLHVGHLAGVYVPADVFARLGSPQSITCDAIETDLGTLDAILPSIAELQLLSHVRLVNVDDRELNAAGMTIKAMPRTASASSVQVRAGGSVDGGATASTLEPGVEPWEFGEQR